jgi:hypothetical protein
LSLGHLTSQLGLTDIQNEIAAQKSDIECSSTVPLPLIAIEDFLPNAVQTSSFYDHQQENRERLAADPSATILYDARHHGRYNNLL